MTLGRMALVMSMALGLASMAQGAVDEKASAFVLCKNQKNVRTIRISPEQNGSCEVTYTKGGSEQNLGSRRDLNGCRSILKNVQNNLEDSKWRCRNVGSARVTTSSEISVQ